MFCLKKIQLLLICICAIATSAFSQSSQSSLHIEGRFLVDGNGKKVILRGPELVNRWGQYTGITDYGVDVAWDGGKNNNVNSTQIREIGKTKANAMRILGGKDNELDDLLYTAIVEQKMYVAVARVDWKNEQIKASLKKYSDYVIIHPRGEFTHDDANLWRSEALNVIKQIRGLGYTNVIEIGTTGYGQNFGTILKHGKEIAESDPLKKTMFLTQLYSSNYAVNDLQQTMTQIKSFPYPVIGDACLFTSPYGNNPNTYKQVWDETFKNDISSFYWDWWGDGEGNSMTTNGNFNSLTNIGQYVIYDSPAALINTVKGEYILNAPNGPTQIEPTCDDAITFYAKVNENEWTQAQNLQITAGDSIIIGPHPTDEQGKWTWSGPESFSATSREITLLNSNVNQGGNYQAEVELNGCVYNNQFTLEIKAPDPVSIAKNNLNTIHLQVANGIFKLEGLLPGEIYYASLFGFQGKQLMSHRLTTQNASFQTQLPAGQYILRLQNLYGHILNTTIHSP